MPSSATVIDRDEAERVKAVLAYEILDTLPDPAFDEIARLASSFAGARYAFIGFADWSRVWFKSRIGFTASQVALAGSACRIVVSSARPLVIDDASADSRLAPTGFSLGEGFQWRSYAAAPLIDSSGAVLGVLGVASPEPHRFNRNTLPSVEVLARQAVTRLELYARGSRQERVLRGRQQAERELTIERNFVAAVLDATNALVVVLDAGGQVVRINRAGERLSGRRLEDLAGRPFPREIWPPEERPAAVELFENARAGKQSPSREMASMPAAGGRRTLSWSAVAMAPYGIPAAREAGGGRVQKSAGFVIMTGVDVTEKAESERELRALMRQRESILESVEDGIAGIDMEGRLSFINPSGARLVGYTVQEMLGKELHSLVHNSRPDGSSYAQENCPILSSLHEGTPVRVSSDFFQKKDGGFLAVEYAACPLMDDGAVKGTVLVFQDATKRHQLDRMKDEFTATVSHELRTPLTSLRAALGLVAGGALANRPEKIPAMLELAVANCDRLVRLVNDIVDFERIRAESLPLNLAETSVIELISRAIEAEQPEAARAGLTLRIDAQPVTVSLDRELILKVLGKLIQNAVKFSERGKEVRLSVEPTSETEVTFSVEDHGCGIRPEDLGRIFDSFHHADASDARAIGGAGLGLATCRSIVVRHGGRIWAESRVGEGSKFFFTLPRTAAPASPASAASGV